MMPHKRSFEGLVFSGLLAVAAATPGLANAQFNTSAMTGFPTSGSPASMAGAAVGHAVMDSSPSQKSSKVFVSDEGGHENVKSIKMSYAPGKEDFGRLFTAVVEPYDPLKPVKVNLKLNSSRVKAVFDEDHIAKDVSGKLNAKDKSISFEGNASDGLIIEIYPYQDEFSPSTTLTVYTFDKSTFEKEKGKRAEISSIVEKGLLGVVAGIGLLGVGSVFRTRRP